MKSGVLADGCNDVDIYVLGSLQYAVYVTSETSICIPVCKRPDATPHWCITR